jgi:hypothetical protein
MELNGWCIYTTNISFTNYSYCFCFCYIFSWNFTNYSYFFYLCHNRWCNFRSRMRTRSLPAPPQIITGWCFYSTNISFTNYSYCFCFCYIFSWTFTNYSTCFCFCYIFSWTFTNYSSCFWSPKMTSPDMTSPEPEVVNRKWKGDNFPRLPGISAFSPEFL